MIQDAIQEDGGNDEGMDPLSVALPNLHKLRSDKRYIARGKDERIKDRRDAKRDKRDTMKMIAD